MDKKDSLHRFIIESAGVRGACVSLDEVWADVRGRRQYPALIQQLLGQAFAAAALLATTIKFDGRLTLQIRGDGPIHLLVVQLSAGLKMRGLARWSSVPQRQTLQDIFGSSARMTITIETKDAAQPYQGIVALEGDSLSDALRLYFRNSEQLQTELILAVDQHSASGLLLQKLPDSSLDVADPEENWQRILLLSRTLEQQELLTLNAGQLLQRLYHQEQVRLFAAQTLEFKCGCSWSRTDGLIQGLGRGEAQEILHEQGDITITCEFCNKVYSYDTAAVARLFKPGAADSVSDGGEIKGPTLH